MDRNDKKHLGIRMIILDCFKKSEIYQDDLFRCADLFEQQIAQAKKEVVIETIDAIENRLNEKHHYVNERYKTNNYSISKKRWDEFIDELKQAQESEVERWR